MFDQGVLNALRMLAEKLNLVEAEILRDKDGNFVPSFTQEYALDTETTRERPIDHVEFPFRSLMLSDGTDVETYIYVILGKNSKARQPVKLKNNATYVTDFQLSEITIFSPAQAGKKITVNLFKNAVVQSGSLVNDGTVSVARPSTLVGPTRVTLGATTATLLFPADPTRKTGSVQNKTGGDLYVGGSTIGAVGSANEGLKYPNDSIIIHENTGELWGWSVAGGNVHKIEES